MSAEQRFGEILRRVRTSQSVSQRALADSMVDAGQTVWVQSTVGKAEVGERPLRLSEFITLCELLGEDPIEVLQEVVDTTARTEKHKYVSALRAELRAIRRRREQLDSDLAEAAEIEAGLTEELHSAERALLESDAS